MIKRNWTPEQDAELCRVYQARQYGGIARLSRRWGIPPTSLSARALLNLGQERLAAHPGHLQWTELECELLESYRYLPDVALARLLERRTGVARSAKAVSVQRCRLGLDSKPDGGDAFSPRLIASGLGCAINTVYRWIDRGWLAVRKSPESKHLRVTPAALRDFLVCYTAHWDAAKADKWFLVDILADAKGSKHPNPRPHPSSPDHDRDCC